MDAIALCLILRVPWVGLQCMVMVFPDHTHLLFFFVHPTIQQFFKLEKLYQRSRDKAMVLMLLIY